MQPSEIVKNYSAQPYSAWTTKSILTVSLYIATSDSFISIIFESSQDAVLRTTVEGVQYSKSITKGDPTQQGALLERGVQSGDLFRFVDPFYAIAVYLEFYPMPSL